MSLAQRVVEYDAGLQSAAEFNGYALVPDALWAEMVAAAKLELDVGELCSRTQRTIADRVSTPTEAARSASADPLTNAIDGSAGCPNCGAPGTADQHFDPGTKWRAPGGWTCAARGRLAGTSLRIDTSISQAGPAEIIATLATSPSSIVRRGGRAYLDDLQSMLGLVDRWAPMATIEKWSKAQLESAERWAAKTHLKASDNNVRVPKCPRHVEKLEPVGDAFDRQLTDASRGGA